MKKTKTIVVKNIGHDEWMGPCDTTTFFYVHGDGRHDDTKPYREAQTFAEKVSGQLFIYKDDILLVDGELIRGQTIVY